MGYSAASDFGKISPSHLDPGPPCFLLLVPAVACPSPRFKAWMLLDSLCHPLTNLPTSPVWTATYIMFSSIPFNNVSFQALSIHWLIAVGLMVSFTGGRFSVLLHSLNVASRSRAVCPWTCSHPPQKRISKTGAEYHSVSWKSWEMEIIGCPLSKFI